GALHEIERFARAELRHRDTGNRGGWIQIVACDELRSEHSTYVEQAAERPHLPGLVGNDKLADVFQVPARIALRLYPDLEALIELVEEIDVGGSQIGLQRIGDVIDGDPERFRHRSVDVEIELRAAGAEGGKADAEETRPVASNAKDLLHRLLQLGQT